MLLLLLRRRKRSPARRMTTWIIGGEGEENEKYLSAALSVREALSCVRVCVRVRVLYMCSHLHDKIFI